VHEGSATGDFADLLGKNPVHAIVLEAWIDTDEGVSRCARLKATTSIPFICFSGDAKPEAVANAQRSGARNVLLEPLREDLLLERLAEMVQWKDRPERTQ
jgi:response regulator RpfG family c-di-GMP phosphodiesterase